MERKRSEARCAKEKKEKDSLGRAAKTKRALQELEAARKSRMPQRPLRSRSRDVVNASSASPPRVVTAPAPLALPSPRVPNYSSRTVPVVEAGRTRRSNASAGESVVAAMVISSAAVAATVAVSKEEATVPLPPTISSRVPAAKGIQQGFSPPGEALTGHPQPTSAAEVVPREDATAVASPSAAPAASSVTRQLPSGRLMETRSASTNHKVDVEVPTRSDASLRAVAAAPLEYEPAMSSAQVDAVISGGLASRTDKSRTSRDGSGGSGGGRGGSNGSGGGNEGTAACDGKAHLVRTEAETGSIDVDALLAAPEDLAADAVRSAAKAVASEGVLAAPAPKKYMNGDGNGNGDGSGSGNGNGNGNGNGGGNGNESGNENRPGLGNSVTQREPMVPSLFGPSRASPAADAASPDSTATAASAVYGCDEEVAGEWGAGTDSSDALDYRFSPKEDAESTGKCCWRMRLG
eukprot:jgi/Undpi1/4741/HiC_scaffold_18.g08094.m1